jgi:hypothetical protein
MHDSTRGGNFVIAANQPLCKQPQKMLSFQVVSQQVTLTSSTYTCNYGAIGDWTPDFSYANAGTLILPTVNNAGHYVYSNAAACTSGHLANEPAWIQTQDAATNISDNTCTWNYAKLYGPGLYSISAGNCIPLDVYQLLQRSMNKPRLEDFLTDVDTALNQPWDKLVHDLAWGQ